MDFRNIFLNREKTNTTTILLEKKDKNLTYEEKFRIRQAEALKTKDDVDEIVNTMSKVDKEFFGITDKDNETYLTEEQCGWVVKRFLYKKNNIPISFFDLLRDGDNLNVSCGTRSGEEYRGKGYATKLSKNAILWCEKNKELWNDIVWGVRKDNIASINLAKKLNFKLDHTYEKRGKEWVVYKYKKMKERSGVEENMEFKNIFYNKSRENKSLFLPLENKDIDIQTYCLETMIALEEEFYQINSDNLLAAHYGIKEENLEILHEGFGDFINSAITFFSNLINRLKDFIKNVFLYISNFIGDFDKFINTHKDEIKKLNPDFDIQGYNYTINDSIPDLSILNNLIQDFNSEVSNIDKLKKSDIISQRNEFNSSVNKGKMRASILKRNSELSAEEFQQEIKLIYRDGEESQNTIHVDQNYLIKVVDNFPNVKRSFETIRRETDKAIILVNNLKNFFEKSANVYYRNNKKTIGTYKISNNNGSMKKDERVERDYDVDKLYILNTFFSFKFLQAKEIGNLTVSAMMEKTNALKEQLALYKSIVRRSFFNKETK